MKATLPAFQGRYFCLILLSSHGLMLHYGLGHVRSSLGVCPLVGLYACTKASLEQEQQ